MVCLSIGKRWEDQAGESKPNCSFMRYGGMPRTASKIWQRYSPMMPRTVSIIPPMNETMHARVVHPRGVEGSRRPSVFCNNTPPAYRILAADIKIPIIMDARNGTFEKDVMPSIASRTSFVKPYLGSPL